jgi:hypothetical protein
MNRTCYLAFVFFAAALFFSIMREWSAPVACPFPGITRGIPLSDQ